jgi:type I restriction enzyme S subunit
MSFPRYPKYKESGAEWLAQVPEHWELNRSDAYLTATRTQLDPTEFKEKEVFHYSIPVVQELGTGQLEDGSEIASAKQVVTKPVVLVSKLNPRKATVCIAEPQKTLTLCSTEFVALEPLKCSMRFLQYLVLSEEYKQELDSKVASVTKSHQRANPADIYKFWYCWPTDNEQTAIADFLDRETAKIDELVSEQHKLIELLKEKRQAVISQAVTKGLNPDAPMKDSGIEWLGQVPAHWEVLKGSLIGKLFGSEQVPEGQIIEEGDLPFIKVASLSSDSFVIKSWDWFVHRLHSSQYRTRNNFIVLPKRGAAIFLNKVNIVNRPSLIDPNLMGWEIGSRADASFIAYALKSRRLDELADISSVPQINNKHIGPERFPLPPLKEQRLIVAFLAGELSKLDTLIQEALKAINLLQERRSALISAAVTGQIDVRTQPQK